MQVTTKERGILLANLGSPSDPSVPAVRRYLNEFLMDPYVVSLPKPLRFLLVQVILRTRPAKTTKAYAEIWNEDGGPLLSCTRRVAKHLEEATDLNVAVGMRYGEPSFETAHRQLSGCKEILLVSPYPQYAESTTKSMVEHFKKSFENKRCLTTPPYYNDDEFIQAQSRQIHEHMLEETDHLLFSFHGIPVQHILSADPTGKHCLKTKNCCDMASISHATCYRHQCYETAISIAENVSVPWSLSFQSRLGRATWLTPYTIDHIRSLADKGVRRLAVVCPSFISDNLETLHEIAIEAEAIFRHSLGESLTLIPSLNLTKSWLDLLERWCTADESALVRL